MKAHTAPKPRFTHPPDGPEDGTVLASEFPKVMLRVHPSVVLICEKSRKRAGLGGVASLARKYLLDGLERDGRVEAEAGGHTLVVDISERPERKKGDVRV